MYLLCHAVNEKMWKQDMDFFLQKRLFKLCSATSQKVSPISQYAIFCVLIETFLSSRYPAQNQVKCVNKKFANFLSIFYIFRLTRNSSKAI